MARRNNKIPDRWLDYDAVGSVIEDSRFLAIKTPLDNLEHVLEENEKFNCQDAISIAEEKSGRKVGMVIDLTFTHRYYNASAFRSKNVKYLKIKVPGQVIPPMHLVKQFQDAVSKFDNNNESNSDMILVHCTHGLNRTGYFVCKYLIEIQNIPPVTAIQRFNDARGHCMERENFIDDLKSPFIKHDSTNNERGSQANDLCMNSTANDHASDRNSKNTLPFNEEYSNFQKAMTNCPSGYFYIHTHPSHYMAPRYSHKSMSSNKYRGGRSAVSRHHLSRNQGNMHSNYHDPNFSSTSQYNERSVSQQSNFRYRPDDPYNNTNRFRTRRGWS